ncbi:TPA: hypothetical protein QDB04_001080 [Burkholderia vietnamiensis]|nr:hypothetical protein [Burkholderia vietnamiensis]HDR9104273.1 hypothetical protein [Burkholderia vietnamiensis]
MTPPWMHHFAGPQARTLRNRHAMQPALSTPAVTPAIESRLYAHQGTPADVERITTVSHPTDPDDFPRDCRRRHWLVPPEQRPGVDIASARLGRHVTIGAGSVLPGCEIGEGASVEAMSRVTQSLAPWGTHDGVPALLIKKSRRSTFRQWRPN